MGSGEPGEDQKRRRAPPAGIPPCYVRTGPPFRANTDKGKGP